MSAIAAQPQKGSNDFKTAAPALDRGLGVLAFLRRRRRGAPVAEIVQEIGIPPASAYRLLNTLERRRFVVKNADDGRYRLGSEILLLAGSMLARQDMRSVAHPHLRDLFDRVKETVELSVLESDHVVLLDKVEGDESVHILNIGGHRSPFVDSAGVVLLESLDEKRLADVWQRQLAQGPARRRVGAKKLQLLLERSRQQGFLADDVAPFDGAQRRSRRVAVPIRDHMGRVKAVLCLAIAVSRWQPERIPRLSRILKQTAKQINELMGFRDQVGEAGKTAKAQ